MRAVISGAFVRPLIGRTNRFYDVLVQFKRWLGEAFSKKRSGSDESRNGIPMSQLPFEAILDHRARTFHLLPGQRLKSKEEAVRFVEERGFVYFWPIKEIALPSLWSAVAGDRPVADAHDDPGHVTWGWKDALLGSSAWYYAKVLRKRATMISMALAPYFYALTENYGSPEEDYLTLYEQGRLTQEARQIYEALLQEGPLDTVALRKAARLASRESDGRFNKALTDLQVDFKISPVGVRDAGAWHYAFAYEITARHYPELPVKAHEISEREARQELLKVYFQSVGAARLSEAVKLFGWRVPNTDRAIDRLVQAGLLCRGVKFTGQPGEWIALAELSG
jgi:hypothetical protein